jgi:hypothetical protein
MADESLWSQCSKDEDCVEIDFYCAGGIVNKKFKKELGLSVSLEYG